MQKPSHEFIRILLLVTFCSQALMFNSVYASSDKGPKADLGKAPNFVLPGLSKKVQLSKYHGKVVYLDFWASWCTPCRKSFSWMNKMQSIYGKKGLRIIAVNLDESRHLANTFLNQHPPEFSVAFDPQGLTAELYKVQGMPSSYLIDPNGKIAYRHMGFRPSDEKRLEQKIQELVGTL